MGFILNNILPVIILYILHKIVKAAVKHNRKRTNMLRVIRRERVVCDARIIEYKYSERIPMDRYTVNLYSDAKVCRTEQGFETSHGRSHGKITRDYRWSRARMVYLSEQKTIESTFPAYSNGLGTARIL